MQGGHSVSADRTRPGPFSGDTKLGLSSAPVVFGVDTAKHLGIELGAHKHKPSMMKLVAGLLLNRRSLCVYMRGKPRYMAPIIKDSVQLTIVGYLLYIGDWTRMYSSPVEPALDPICHRLLPPSPAVRYQGETNYALGLLALILPQVYFAKTLFLEDPIKNDVHPA